MCTGMSTTQQHLYLWGANSHGQLGLGFASESCTLPVRLTPDLLPIGLRIDEIAEISGGGGHMLLLTATGALFACGWNNRGQLGVDATRVDALRLVAVDGRHFNDPLTGEAAALRTIRTGWDCSAAMTDSGVWFVWGSNAFDRFGLGKELDGSIVDAPRRFQLPGTDGPNRRCLDIRFGLRITCAVTATAVYIFASAKVLARMSLSSRHRFETFVCPTNDVSYGKLHVAATHVACGVNHFVYAVDELNKDGDSFTSTVYVCGENKYSHCTQTRPADSRIVRLQSGWSFAAVLHQNGRATLFGRNDYGQLGVRRSEGEGEGVDESGVLLPLLSAVRQLHLGAENCLAVLDDGAVCTWGWNEHGNCGNGTEENVWHPIGVALPGECRLAGTGSAFCAAVVVVVDCGSRNADSIDSNVES